MTASDVSQEMKLQHTRAGFSESTTTLQCRNVENLTRIAVWLMFACFGLLCISTGTAVYFSAFSSQLGVGSNLSRSEAGTGTSSNPLFCVDKSEVSLLNATGVCRLGDETSASEVCFGDFRCALQIMSLIQASLLKRTNLLEQKMQTIEADRSHIPSKVNYKTSGIPSGSKIHDLPFAHVFLDVTARYTDNSYGPLKWTRSSMEGSILRDLELNPGKEEIRIIKSGVYVIYSHVTYNARSMNEESVSRGHTLHSVYKNYRDLSDQGKQRLLTSRPEHGGSSFLQGMFHLTKDDTITVCAHRDGLRNDLRRLTYLGLIMM